MRTEKRRRSEATRHGNDLVGARLESTLIYDKHDPPKHLGHAAAAHRPPIHRPWKARKKPRRTESTMGAQMVQILRAHTTSYSSVADEGRENKRKQKDFVLLVLPAFALARGSIEASLQSRGSPGQQPGLLGAHKAGVRPASLCLSVMSVLRLGTAW